MAHLQIFAVIIAGLAITQAFVVPQNDGTQIRDQILNQKFSFLDSLFKNSAVDVEAIKAKIKSEDSSPIKGPNIEPTQVDNNAIRNDILNNKFAFLENHLKQFNVDVNGIKDRVSASMALKHAMAKRAVPENGPVDGLTIRDHALEQKFAFLENLLKQYNVDFNAIKERIKASTGQHSVAKRAVPEGGAVDGVAIRDQVLEEKFAFLENLLKQYNVNFSAIKERIKASTEQHSIAKRAVAEGGAAPEPVDGIAIRDQVLNQKFEYLSNLLGGLVDFNAIKERIKASTEQHSIAKRAVTEGGAAPEPLDGIAIRDQVLNQKFEYLSNLLGGLVDFNAIKERIKASTEQHSIAKRAVTEGGAAPEPLDGIAIRDQVLDQKFEYLSNLLGGFVDFNAIKERIKASSGQHSIAKRAVSEGGAAPEPLDGIAIRDQVLNQKFEYLSNLLGGLVDFNAIKERIKASTEQHSIAKRAVTEGGAAPEPLDGIAIRDQVLDQKFEYLSNLLGGFVDFNAIKERIKASTGQHSIAKRAVSEGGAAPEPLDGIAIRDQVLAQKFEYLSNLLGGLVDFNAIKERIKASTEQHSIAKRAVTEGGAAPEPLDGIAKRDQVLDQKFEYLSNLLGGFVDFNAIKERIKASTGQHSIAKRAVPEGVAAPEPLDGIAIRDQVLNQKFEYLSNLLAGIVDFNAIKERIKASTEQHSIAKRAVSEGGAAPEPLDGIAIRDQVLNQKFEYLSNLLAGIVDFNAIKERIKASTGQHSIAKRAVSEGGAAPEYLDGIAIRDQVLDQKFEYLSNFLAGLVDFNAIKERIKASTEKHSIAKRAITEDGAAPEPLDGIAKRDQVLNEKFEYLSNLLGGLVDFNAIKERIKASTGAHSVSKREVPSTETPALGGDFINGLTGAINAALKSLADALLVNINASTNGIFQGTDILVNLQALLYGLVDRSFPTTTTSYTSLLTFGV